MRYLFLAAALLAAPAFAEKPVPLHYTGAACFTDHMQVTVGGSTFVQCHTALEAAISAHSSATVGVAQVRFCAADGSGPLMAACANYVIGDAQPGGSDDGIVTIGEILGISGFAVNPYDYVDGPVTIGEILGIHRSLREQYRLDEFERDLHSALTRHEP